jgi:hypothetical protein
LEIARARRKYRRYRQDPCGYARDVLAVRWWARQVEIAEALLKYRRVFVKASHSVGKSHLAGGLVNWFFDAYGSSIAITTAPNAQQVIDILWKEVRVQRKGRPGLLPKAPRMELGPEHFAVGLTARDDSGFQGRHARQVLIVFDEAVGVESPFWDAAEGMMTGDCYWLAICNPTDTSSRAFVEASSSGKWHVIEISALEHPNIVADLAGLPVPFPAAVRLDWILGRLQEWCDPLPDVADRRAQDIEFPPGSGYWYRPGPLFESRVLGRWPSQGVTSVWSDATWLASLEALTFEVTEPVVIGCDVARFGDDFTSIVVRRGCCALHHETHNGWSTSQTAGRLRQLAAEYGNGWTPHPRPLSWEERGEGVPVTINVDDDGVGGGVVDQLGDLGAIAVSGAEAAVEPEGYPNRRSELWFVVALRAAERRLDLSRLSDASRNLIRNQVMSPVWKVDGQGRRMVEAKADTKRRIGRSPDDADALNLAFARQPVLQADTAAHARFWGTG